MPAGILVGSLPASGLPAWAMRGEKEATKPTANAVTNPPNLLLENLSTANTIVLLQFWEGSEFRC
ncbi:exported hypothetical protein [Mesorhizobium metallidurans STM 2683]|uniref:Uncharacterized protein n=1 Tax=Mesorhizobium metallidurans STM 2683 TaxID=1297569 RepID=M5ETL4_9HYPH|nr:exported hypothetical protein [Mesorhizobium metallidurans STM 2683]